MKRLYIYDEISYEEQEKICLCIKYSSQRKIFIKKVSISDSNYLLVKLNSLNRKNLVLSISLCDVVDGKEVIRTTEFRNIESDEDVFKIIKLEYSGVNYNFKFKMKNYKNYNRKAEIEHRLNLRSCRKDVYYIKELAESMDFNDKFQIADILSIYLALRNSKDLSHNVGEFLKGKLEYYGYDESFLDEEYTKPYQKNFYEVVKVFLTEIYYIKDKQYENYFVDDNIDYYDLFIDYYYKNNITIVNG